MQPVEEPMDMETVTALAHLAGQTASELREIDKLSISGSQNTKGLQYDPKEIIQKNFLSRVPRNPNSPVAVPRPPFQPPQTQPQQQMVHPQQMVQQPMPQMQQSAMPVISDVQYNLLIEKLCTLERLLSVCIEGQDSLQSSLDKTLTKLLQKKLKDIKITFNDDNSDS